MYYRPRQAFTAPGPDGQMHNFGPDPLPAALVREGHWVLSGREALFEPFDLEAAVAEVETATAEPGAKRSVSVKADDEEDGSSRPRRPRRADAK